MTTVKLDCTATDCNAGSDGSIGQLLTFHLMQHYDSWMYIARIVMVPLPLPLWLVEEKVELKINLLSLIGLS